MINDYNGLEYHVKCQIRNLLKLALTGRVDIKQAECYNVVLYKEYDVTL